LYATSQFVSKQGILFCFDLSLFFVGGIYIHLIEIQDMCKFDCGILWFLIHLPDKQ
jgi:hypothetical protein